MTNTIGNKRFWLAIIAILMLSACKMELYSTLPEQEANEMLAILLNHDISSEKFTVKGDIYGLKVEKKDVERAIITLKNRGYPKRHFIGINDIFPGDSTISSSLEQKARLNYALTQELSETILEFDGVLSARVHIAIPSDTVGDQVAPPGSASVFIKHDRDYDLVSFIPQIKNLLLNSVGHIDYEHVSVVLVPSVALAMTERKKVKKPYFLTPMHIMWLVLCFLSLVAALVFIGLRVKSTRNKAS